jgi:hypothetical protein
VNGYGYVMPLASSSPPQYSLKKKKKKIERKKRACISLIENIPFNTKGHLNQSEVQAAT